MPGRRECGEVDNVERLVQWSKQREFGILPEGDGQGCILRLGNGTGEHS
jgi:hypothetical protein